MALRRAGWSLAHAMAIGGAVFMGAWEVYNHDFSNSTDVYRGPGKPSVTLPLNTSIAPSIESLEESTSVSSITEVPTFTTTEYITITQTPKNENNGPTSAPYIYGSMNGRNPYANNSYVQSMIHTIAPIYGNSFVKALVKIIQIVWNNFFIQHIVRLITSVISFGFYLWALLPGGLQGLVELLVGWSTLFGALIWLWQWLFPRGNTAPPADGSPPPSSDGRPGGDGGEPPSGVPGSTDASAGPKPSTNTTSAGTQTTTNTTSTETQTVISNSTVSQAERDCQRTLQRVRNELEEARASTAANDQTIAHQEQRITDLQQGNTDLRQIVEGLRQSHAQDAKIIEELTELNIERGRQESGTITYLRDNVNTFRMQRDKTAELHADEIKDLQAERDTAVTDLESATESHQEEIKRLNEAHEAEVNEIKSSRDATIEKLQSEVDDLHRDVEKLEHANEGLRNQNTAYDEEISSNPGTPVSTKAAEKRHKLELEEAIAKEKAKARNEVDQLKKKVSQLEKEQQKEKSKKKKTDSSLFASPPEDESEQVRKFREENSRLTGLLFKKDATEKQNKLSAEAQKEQETALADCNDKVQALENTNTELAKQNEALQSTNNQLTQQNETLQEQEAQAKDAEEKSRSRADGLQVEVESLKTSLSNAGDGNKAAVQAAEDLRVAEERSNDRESNLQRQLAQARDTENGLENRLSQGELQLQDTQARLERSQTDLENTQTALNTTQAELHKSQAEDKRLRGEGQAILNERESLKLRCTTAENERDALRSNNDILQADRAKLQAKNDSLQKGGDELTINYNALQQALAEQHKKCSEEKKQLLQRTRAEQERKCNEEKQKLRKEAQAAYDHEKSNGKNLREQLRQQQEQNEELQDEITGLNNEIEMKDKNIANLISTNQGLANQDLESGMARALREAADAEEEMEDDTNQPPQQTPFTNAPSFPPSQPATAPPHSPKRGSGAPDVFDVQSNTKSSNALARKIAPLRSSRNNSPTRKLTDGTAPSTPTRSRHTSPLRNLFDPTSLRPTTPNVFDPMNGFNRPVNTDFTNGGLRNGPVLLPTTGGPASTAGDSDMTSPEGSPRAGDVNMASPSRNPDRGDITMTKEEREHEQRKAEAARQHQVMLDNQRRDDLGDFDSDEPPADSAMDTAPNSTSPTDATMDNAPAAGESPSASTPAGNTPAGSTPGGLFSPLIPYSTAEINLLRSLPGNAEGAYDNEYRGNYYQPPDIFTEEDGPGWYRSPLQRPKFPPPKPKGT